MIFGGYTKIWIARFFSFAENHDKNPRIKVISDSKKHSWCLKYCAKCAWIRVFSDPFLGIFYLFLYFSLFTVGLHVVRNLLTNKYQRNKRI